MMYLSLQSRLATALTFLTLLFCIPAHAQISSSTWGQGAMRTGTSTTTCDASAEGAIRYNATSDTMEYCNAVSWSTVGATADYTTNLIGWWKFDESSGTTAADSSGNGRNGTTVNSPTWQPSGGKIGGALACDGTNDYVYVPDNAAWDVSNVTISLWVNKKITDGSGYGVLFGREHSTGGDDTHNIAYYDTTSDQIAITMWLGAAAQTLVSIETTLLEVNSWVHYAFTYDGSSIKIYQNGKVLASGAYSGAMPAETNRLMMCANDNSPGVPTSFANAWIDDVRFYNAALTAAQIDQIYKAAGGVP